VVPARGCAGRLVAPAVLRPPRGAAPSLTGLDGLALPIRLEGEATGRAGVVALPCAREPELGFAGVDARAVFVGFPGPFGLMCGCCELLRGVARIVRPASRVGESDGRVTRFDSLLLGVLS